MDTPGKSRRETTVSCTGVKMCHFHFPGGSDGIESAHSPGDPGLIPGLGRSPGEGSGYPLQYSYLENLIDSRAWQAIVHEVAMS